MDVLISAGAQLDCPDADGLSPIHRAARMGTLPEILERMLRAKACVQVRDSAGRGPLQHAAETEGGENLVKMLMEASAAVDVNALDESGHSALHVACSVPRCKFMLALIDAGADIEVTGEGGRTPLLQALYWQDPTLVESVMLLINAKANIEARGGDGSHGSSKTALHFGTYSHLP
jgi:ankyrin repeat protein